MGYIGRVAHGYAPKKTSTSSACTGSRASARDRGNGARRPLLHRHLTQISAVSTALESLSLEILDDHVTHCVAARSRPATSTRPRRRQPSCSPPSPLRPHQVIVGVDIWAEIVDALSFSFGMLWAILWALILGFALSASSRPRSRRRRCSDCCRTTARGRSCARPRWRGVVVVLLRRGRARTLALQARRRLHLGDGLRDRLHQPRRRARDRDRTAARLGVRARRVSSAAR